MIVILLIGTIYSILLDELIMGNTQRRKGPFNLGAYGILSSIINGFNLIISQFLIPKLYIHYWFQAFPIAFLLFSLAIYNVIFPFLFIDLYLSFILLLLLSGISIILLFLLSYTGLSKYSMLGCIRLISQFVSYELILTTLLLLLICSNLLLFIIALI
jgi:NADH:ubiquinone oxidoreductase subunit H